MKAAQVVHYGEPIRLTEVPEPSLAQPTDVIVRVAGSGVCRTDVHILHGDLDAAFSPTLPYTLGHENSGWVHAVGPAVEHLQIGDPVLVHPAVTCGHCPGCRAGNDMWCAAWRFPGVDGWSGGYAELLHTTARSIVALPAGVDPTALAPHADAGLTAMHAVRRLAPHTDSRSSIVVFGAGGVGQVAVQLLRILTPAQVLVVEPDAHRAQRALELGAAEVLSPEAAPAGVLERTEGRGATAVLDLVGEGGVPAQALAMLTKGGVYSIVGYGGRAELDLLDMINRELTVLGNQIGTYGELLELVALVGTGQVTLETELYPLDSVIDVLRDAEHGRLPGRAVLVPTGS